MGTLLAGTAFFGASFPASSHRQKVLSCLAALPPWRHAREALAQLPGLPWLAYNVASTMQEQGHQLVEPPAALNLFRAVFFLDCNTFPTALQSLKAGIWLCLQSSICLAGTHKYDSWLNTQPVKPYMNLHVGQAARWKNCSSNKMVNSRAVGKPGEMVMLLMLLSFSNRGNGTQQ